ncbi:MAG: hypothetical protein KDM63_05400, partial [Verrucomicrobiae bacterium]|nr:hypothetical protein [Verrucomicrobiae bacterium]
PAIAAYWDDLNPAASGVGRVYAATTGSGPDRQLIVQWNAIVEFLGTDPVTFQLVLNESDDSIEIRYQDVNATHADNGESATIAIHDGNARYLQYSYNAASIQNGQRLVFTAPSGRMEDLSFTLAAIDDILPEGEETFRVALGSPSNSGLTGARFVDTAIEDNDGPTASVTLAPVSQSEAGPITFSATLDHEVPGGFTVNVSSLAGTAQSGIDFEALSETLTFAGNAGEMVTFSVTLIDDSIIESDETFTVVLSGASSGLVDISGTAVGTILDNDARIAPTGPNTGVTTDIELVANGTGGFDLVIEDVETESAFGFGSEVGEADSTDHLLIYRDGADYVIRDTEGLWLGSPIIGASRNGVNEIRVPVAMVTGSILVRTGIDDDIVTIGDLGASLAGNLIIDTEDPADAFSDFDVIYYGADVALGAGASSQFAADTIQAQANSGLEASGAGTVTWIAGRNILMSGGASVVTDAGDITFEANLADQGNGNFVGILLEGATVTSTTGAIDFTGRGGDTGNNNDGVRLMHDKATGATSALSTGGAIALVGTGGRGGAGSAGIYALGASLTSTASTIDLTGQGGDRGGYSHGVRLAATTVTASGGDLTILGTGGGTATTSSNYGITIYGNSTLFAGGAGAMSLTGSGGASLGGLNVGVYLGDTTATVANGDLTILGTGGSRASSNNSQNRGVFTERSSLVSTGSGDISITGSGAGGGTKSAGVTLVSTSVSADGSGSIILVGTGTAVGTVLNHGISLLAATVRTQGGDLTVTGQGGGVLRKNSGVEIGAASVLSVRAGAGSLTISGTAGSGDSDNVGVSVNGAQLTTANGALTVEGTGNGTVARNRGVYLNKSTLRTTGTGSVTLSGTGSATSTGKSNEGVVVNLNTISTTGTGGVTISGTGGRGDGKNHGVALYAGTLGSARGAVSLTGVASSLSTGKGNVGVLIQKRARIDGASLSIVGTGGRGSGGCQGVSITGGTLRATSGALTIAGTARSSTTGLSNIGVLIQNKVTLSATGGVLSISGTGGGGSRYNHGVCMTKQITAPGADVTGIKGSGAKSLAQAGDFFSA